MSSPTRLVPADLIVEIRRALSRLRLAREVGDTESAAVSEANLNGLLECFPRTSTEQ